MEEKYTKHREANHVKREITGKLFEAGVVEKLSELECDLEKHPAMILVIRNFFIDEEWINYLVHVMNTEKMVVEFEKRLSSHFHPILTVSTKSMDIVSVVVFQDESAPTEKELDARIENLEDDLISFFLSPEYLGRIKDQVDIFQNPFKSFYDFSVGYGFVRSTSTDDIMHAVNIAFMSAQVKKSMRINEYTVELLRILDRRRVETHFQPIVDLKDKRVYAYEALIRGPRGSKLRRPDLLFKIAIYNGLELELDRLARRTHIKRFHDVKKYAPDVRLTVNLGPFTPIFIDEIERDLKRYDIPKDRIIWEVSERTYIDDFVAFTKVIDYLRTKDYRIAVDDFGTGAATFKLIFSVYTNMVKIDKSLVESVEDDTAKRMFLEKMISCFYRPDNLMVVEGVETESEFRTLLEIGYRYHQGYYLFRPSPNPVSDEEVKARLAELDWSREDMYFPMYFENREMMP